MAWSGGLASIRLPFDAVPGGGRNYIDIGEEIPPEISANFEAGLVFRSGDDPTYPNGFDYWAIGITVGGRLEVIGRYFVMGSPGSTPLYKLQSVLSFSPPASIDSSPVITLGAHPSYSTYFDTGAEIRISGRPIASLTQTVQSGFYPAGWGTIALQQIDVDDDSGATVEGGGNPGGFTARRPGWYRLTGTVPMTNVAASAYVSARFVVNGNFAAGKTGPLIIAPIAGDPGALTGEQFYNLLVGDYVQLQ